MIFIHKSNCVLCAAYLVKGQKKVNLIAVNWEKASQTINYFAARKNVGIIGIRVANFIDFMVKSFLNQHFIIKNRNNIKFISQTVQIQY